MILFRRGLSRDYSSFGGPVWTVLRTFSLAFSFPHSRLCCMLLVTSIKRVTSEAKAMHHNRPSLGKREPNDGRWPKIQANRFFVEESYLRERQAVHWKPRSLGQPLQFP